MTRFSIHPNLWKNVFRDEFYDSLINLCFSVDIRIWILLMFSCSIGPLFQIIVHQDVALETILPLVNLDMIDENISTPWQWSACWSSSSLLFHIHMQPNWWSTCPEATRTRCRTGSPSPATPPPRRSPSSLSPRVARGSPTWPTFAAASPSLLSLSLERKILDRPGTFYVFDDTRELIRPLDSGTRFSASFHLHLLTWYLLRRWQSFGRSTQAQCEWPRSGEAAWPSTTPYPSCLPEPHISRDTCRCFARRRETQVLPAGPCLRRTDRATLGGRSSRERSQLGWEGGRRGWTSREKRGATKRMMGSAVFAPLRVVSSGSLAASSTAGTPLGKGNTGGDWNLELIELDFQQQQIIVNKKPIAGVGSELAPNAQHWGDFSLLLSPSSFS